MIGGCEEIMFNHVVMFKLKNPGRDEIHRVRDMLLGLKEKISLIRSLEVGIDLLHSQRSCDLLLLTRFDSLEDMILYQKHPAHVKVSQYIQSIGESSYTVDYE